SQEGPDSLARMAQSQVTTVARVRSLIWGGPLRGLSRFICVHRRPSFSTSIFDRIDLIELIYMTITSSVFAILLLASGARPESLAGLWDATVVVNGLTIPFRMEFSGEGSNVKGSFFNGDEKVTSTRGRL